MTHAKKTRLRLELPPARALALALEKREREVRGRGMDGRREDTRTPPLTLALESDEIPLETMR
jgi:hypothetical protein